MGKFLGGFVLPVLLLTGALINRSLISFVDLIAFLIIQYNAPKIGFHSRTRLMLLWSIVIFSVLVILSQVTYLVIWVVEGSSWSIPGAWWAKLVGFMIVQSWKSPYVIYFLVVQLLALFVALVDIHEKRLFLVSWQDSSWGQFLSIGEQLGSHLRVASCLLLPAIQLVVGISHSSWASLPFFIGSCVGLVDWSLTSNFLGLFRWWRPLQLYAGFNILLLYAYQLPMELPSIIIRVADLIGLYKISANSEWPEICSSVSLICFYMMLSFIKSDLEEMGFIMSGTESSLTEQLLPSKHSFFIHESRSGVRHTNVLLRGAVLRTFSINFFTYGFPVSLFALSFWSFHFASLCAFGLLAYVGYIIYAFPSLFRLHRLNGLLLVFILLWAVSTYIFNVAFTFLNWKLGRDMKIWEMVGLWHYPIPGLFLLAQFCLGILVALGNLVNNSVFLCLSDTDGNSSNNNSSVNVEGETKVLIVATIAWGLRKSSRAIMLTLIFLIATKPGFIHAVYMIFFLIYLLSHNISRKMRQALILLCEVHFALLYILQINLISSALKKKGSISMGVLMQLGLLEEDSSWDFLEVTLLACFCAIHNHGFEMLFSFSAIVQHAPSPPIGFSILKAGLNKSVLLSVYASSSVRYSDDGFSYERRIASYLSAIGQKFLSIYRSCGTYIAFLTILLTVYLVRPNCISFGYIFLLLLWIIGRQLVESSKRRLWFPLKMYSILVFIFVYSLSSFSSLEKWLSRLIDLYIYLGFDSKASPFENVWESVAVLIVMQLYSYERRQSRYNRQDHFDQLQSGVIGFIRRFLIWHSQKILFIALFYASFSPISAFGFLYLLGLVICSTLPKASRVPSKSFLAYTGFVVTAEYLFQMWGKQAEMFPGQKHNDISLFLGFHVFQPGFWGLESGLRGKVLVIAACTLQYNVFRWLERMPNTVLNKEKWEEPCPLFVSTEDAFSNVTACSEENRTLSNSRPPPAKQEGVLNNSSQILSSGFSQIPDTASSRPGGSDSSSRKYSFGFIWGSTMESHKWNKKRIVALRKERFETQKTLLKIYLKFWMENMFNLFGLEINMIALLLASFALLNAISILYIALLAACILLNRKIIRKVWPIFVFLFASILILEYFVIWMDTLSSSSSVTTEIRCHDCWRSSTQHSRYCKKCWLGLLVDDPRIFISYFAVFMLACFKLRADQQPSLSGSPTYRRIMFLRRNTFVWKDLSFETKSMWTFLDYLRLYCYCHLLDLVLILILITGTLEYDILHLGYLAFALVFFRMRLEMLKKKNKIFKYLRIYNFVLIVLSLAYQSPFVGGFSAGKCVTEDYIFEIIGFYKYDYGFRITARSALVEIIIFVLVSLQSYMFSSQEFDYVSRYLEAEQIGAIVREQEKKAAWKTEQLQQIRESEENKRQRNMQVEKMKSEMLNLQLQLHSMNSSTNGGDGYSHSGEGLRRRRSTSLTSNNGIGTPDIEEQILGKLDHTIREDSVFPNELRKSSTFMDVETPIAEEYMKHSVDSSHCEITEIDVDASCDSGKKAKVKGQTKENPLKSAVQLIGDGVSQVQSIGNQAVNNLVSFLNIAQEDSDVNEQTSVEDGIYDEMESQKAKHRHLERSSSLQSDKSSDAASLQLGRIFRHIWSQMCSNNDVVCYCCFILVFLWNFSLLSMVYLAALFLYALCVHTGPSYIFWIIMLIYTEVYILLQYLYQIIIQHCGLSIESHMLREIGFPTEKITSSFVVSSFPLFLVYLFTLIQSSITVKDGEWMSSTDFKFFNRNVLYTKDAPTSYNWHERAWDLVNQLTNMVKLIIRSFFRYWKSLTQGAESPPYFVQVSMDVNFWPEDGIQPERIESGINQLLRNVHNDRCKEKNPNLCPFASRVHVQSIERSQENHNVALVVFEVVYASPVIGCSSAEWYKSLTPAADVAKEILKAQKAGFVEEVGFPYHILSVIGGGKREMDLYAYIFCADLIVFFLVAMFYQSVIKNKSEFLDVYQLEDQFPKEFVFILMVIFFLIVLDRIIYLCSFATGKVIFYIFNLILFTYSVTEYAWQLEPFHQHAAGLALRSIYFAKAVSLALQAVQIRYGIPHKSTLYRQFLTSEVSRINYLGYRLYRALPFLYELRCVLDWSCTTTSLTMYDWLKLEDINASLYLVKCDALLNRATHKQGEKQTSMTKCCNGICLFFVLICVIWAPMLMYSSGNPTNIANPIKDASFQVDIKTVSGRLNLYQTTLCEKLAWDKLKSDANLDPHGYLNTYNKIDIQLICCQADASTLWLVPAVVRTRLIQSLEWYSEMEIFFTWILSRDRPKGKEVVKYEKSIDQENLPSESDVQKVLNGSTNSFRIYNVYPRFFRVTGSGDVRPLEVEDNSVSADLMINHEQYEWWSFHDINSSDSSGCGGLTGPMAIIISEETPPQGILGDTLSKFSIWGLYITFVLAVGRFIRLQCSDLRMRIPFENLPSCDRLIAICEDIYAARAEGELGVEEVLYWTLVKIYRSPHMLLEYTKPD
ncbi:piezo-type mechanosensitive ion channel-like protein isoform X1 [Senna tora]|uniref:Piezo-type mechanosensitive ion channel-like protein isoform X1 n=1 Tax=Senna tora TaxID=362788 RepID=A0A834SII2_9FABA|nr:piezo-type mechanosensitive ion channel-like protein isoform X1 [Senna tora]